LRGLWEPGEGFAAIAFCLKSQAKVDSDERVNARAYGAR
jgi:hypothetical protein